MATTNNGGTNAVEAELTPILHPRHQDPIYAANEHIPVSSNGSSNRRPLHFPVNDPTSITLETKFNQSHDDEADHHHHHHDPLAFLPLAPLLSGTAAREITESISTKATEQNEEYTDESEAMQQRKRQLALEQSLNCAAAFFGINVDIAFHPPPKLDDSPCRPSSSTRSDLRDTNDNDDDNDDGGGAGQSGARIIAVSPQKKPTAITPTKSMPIKVNNSYAQNKMNDSDHSFDKQAIHRRSSAPITCGSSSPEAGTLASSRSRPADYVDPKDNHRWRAKYCVLEDNALYFYRSKEDAECQEAKEERRRSDPMSNEALQGISAREGAADLSKSPMATRTCLIIPGADGSLSGGSGSDAESNCRWEKRVALNCVGAVRSAETDFGKNAFELIAVVDDEDEGYANKLVLKAPKQEEMNEWIFQFHRSLASFVMNVVDLSYALGDLHHPSFEAAGFGHSIQTPLKSFNLPTFSPRFVNQIPVSHGATFTHGHGRSQRRRRADFGGSSDSVHSVSSTPTTHSPSIMPFPFPPNFSTHANLVTPLKHGGQQAHAEPERQRPPGQEQQLGQQEQQQEEMEVRAPELSAPQSANPPETERPPPPATGGKYVPPHLRKGKYVPPHLRTQGADGGPPPRSYVPPQRRNLPDGSNENGHVNARNTVIGPRALSAEERERVEGRTEPIPDVLLQLAFKLGGCADPLVISGSILDAQYTNRKSSRVGRAQTNAYGSLGGGDRGDAESNANSGIDIESSPSLEWEIGAVSECGVRESNEDAYFVSNDLQKAFAGIIGEKLSPTYWDGALGHRSGLFAIFDGHCGNEAARFAAERLPHFLYEEAAMSLSAVAVGAKATETIMHRAIVRMDEEFCKICVEEGRNWESGSTALIAMVVEKHLVIANIGDCRGLLCRTFDGARSPDQCGQDGENWVELLLDHESAEGQQCFWKEMAQVHSPSRPDEKERIIQAGGWITTDMEIPIGQLARMDFLDADVIDILRRCFQDRVNDGQGPTTCSSAPQRILQIFRVCGELAVSRAIGDRDFKAAHNMSPSADAELNVWENPLIPLCYPPDHNQQFVGDLVSNKPDFQSIQVGESGAQGEFLLLACDGLWDVIDRDDAVRVTWDLLYAKKCPAKQAVSCVNLCFKIRSWIFNSILTLRGCLLPSKTGGSSCRACYSLGFIGQYHSDYY